MNQFAAFLPPKILVISRARQKQRANTHTNEWGIPHRFQRSHLYSIVLANPRATKIHRLKRPKIYIASLY